MDKKRVFNKLIKKVKEIVDDSSSRDEKLMKICMLLKNEVPYYDWVGFYIADRSKNELVLGPFSGESTEHVRIPFGKGICGQAAQKRHTFVVQDVSKEKNYLSCSPKVKSEIVVPIFKNGKIVGELDIDSHSHAPFTHEDKQFLEEICNIVAKIFEE
jgi:GAF domain-containing protein